MRLTLAALASLVAVVSAQQQCACTQHEPANPFTIDCSDAATIRAATTTLETTCTTANTAYEWGGIFSTRACEWWTGSSVDVIWQMLGLRLGADSVGKAIGIDFEERACVRVYGR